jgi:hypothetical protein
VHHERGERVDEADGQVDLAADQQQHLAVGDDHDRRRDLGEVDQVDPREKGGPAGRVDDAEVQDQQDDHHEYGGLALPHEEPAGPPQPA